MADDADAEALVGDSLDPEALVGACAHGGVLVVSRAPHRTAGLFAAELQAAAEHSGVPAAQLQLLSPGLVLLAPADAGGAPAAAQARLLACLASMGGVRLCGQLLSAAASAQALLEATRPCSADGRRRRWRLEYEVHYPAAEHGVIPFTRLHGAPSLVLGLHAALGQADYADDATEAASLAAALEEESKAEEARAEEVKDEGAGAGVLPLVLLHCKNGLLLMRERPIDRSRHFRAGLEGAAAPAAASETAAVAMHEAGGGGDGALTTARGKEVECAEGEAPSTAGTWRLPW